MVSMPAQSSNSRHPERHRTQHIGWLRAAVLGANDGIVSTASLIIGVAAADANRSGIIVAGVAGLAAGAMSMAAGEYVSVSSQSDTESADLEREKRELHEEADEELAELAAIYVDRGLDRELALRVAEQLTEHDALGAHARDELGISDLTRARPVQAAFASAATFAVGAILPVAVAFFVPAERVAVSVAASTLLFLGLLGAASAKTGGAPIGIGMLRVTFWGALAMAVTAGIGLIFGAAV
jgi:VIT1/CCC1 family predicted Fe2+/Mn2+ transporter